VRQNVEMSPEGKLLQKWLRREAQQ